MSRVNWPQAFAEVGLLVFGAGIALGGDAWMDARRDLRSEQEYLVALRDDFAENVRLLEAYFQNNLSSQKACLQLLEVLAGPQSSVPNDSISRLINDSFWVYHLEPVRATYQDMVSSGDLGLLHSTELRLALAQASEALQSVDVFDDLQWEHWLRLELEFLRRHHDLALVYPNYSGAARRLNLTIEPLQYPDAGFGPDIAALRSRDFRNIVVARTILYQDAIVTGMAAHRLFKEILAVIDRELGRFQ